MKLLEEYGAEATPGTPAMYEMMELFKVYFPEIEETAKHTIQEKDDADDENFKKEET